MEFYGCTSQGGVNNNKGVIFKYQISNNTYTKLYDFDTPTGASPWGNVMMASDGNLYGCTNSGGTNSLGVIYKFNLTTNTYTVIYNGSFATGGIPYADLIEYSGATPVNEIDKKENVISIFPNPSQGSINIQVNNFTKPTTLILTNVLGQEVMQIPITSSALKMNLDLPAGLYFYSAASSSSRSAIRLVVE
ncbi:MAG: T9SS type A sorting domain-containing protein [Bacteroidetes bacterium]|nr:T9SS type A sorting domain-containing protein [Bacteroidota bacterium]